MYYNKKLLKLFIGISIICTACILSAYQETVIEDFSMGKVQKWVPKKKAAIKFIVKPEAGTMKVDLPDKGVNWVFCYLKKAADLKKYPYIEIKIRALKPGFHKYYFYINKKSKEYGAQTFHTILCLKGEKEHTFILDTTRQGSGSRSAAKGYFVYNRGKIRSLKPGGVVKRFAFTSTLNGADFELKSIKMLSEHPSNKANTDKSKSIKGTLISPYKFKRHLKGKELVVVDNGKSEYKIVIPTNPDKTFSFAAESLQKYLLKTTGARLEIASAPYKGKQIELGLYDYQKNNDTFELKGSKNKISIKGRCKRAVLYGVYDFLEKACGIRFFAPMATHEIIPKLDKLVLKPFYDLNSPSMTYRRTNYCSYRNTTMKRRYEVADWGFKNRFNNEGSRLHKGTKKIAYYAKKREEFYQKRGDVYRIAYFWGHNYQRLVNPKKYFKTHPEYFCWNAKTGKYQWKYSQICTTNPDVVKVIADFAEDYFKQYPKRNIFPLFPEDGSRLWCQCKECSKLNAPGIGYSFDHMADRAIYLVNALDKELKRRNINNKRITFSAYQPTKLPPIKLKLTPNSLVSYCIYTDGTEDFTKAVSELPMSSEIEMWAKKTKGGLGIYNYAYMGFFYQFTSDANIVKNYRYYNSLGVKGSIPETFEGWGFDDYLMYLATRLAWNPWIDTDAFRRDYFAKIYGPAAKMMGEFRGICQNVLSDYPNFIQCDLRRFPNFKPKHLKQLKDCLDKAKSVAKGNERILQAIERKEKLYTYICTFSQTINSARNFFLNINEKNYQKVVAATANLKKLVGKLYRDKSGEIVAFRITRMVTYIANAAKRLYRQHVLLKKISSKYKYIENLPVKGWRFQKDPFSKGDKQHWDSLKNYKNWSPIKIGTFWEKQCAKGYDGFAYYQLSYKLPSKVSSNKKCYLYFLGVDEQAWVYVNGKLAGKHTGEPTKMWLEPFLINISSYVKAGQTCNIVVKVHDSGGGGGIWQDVLLLSGK
jgi:Domain of unknown function (DUF4838)/Glycosyl hydrolases family 2, sugar binding domain